MTRDNTPDDAPVYLSSDGEATKAKPDATEQKTPPVERDALLALMEKAIDRWLDEPEGFGFRRERLIEDIRFNPLRVYDWLREAALLAQPDLSGEDGEYVEGLEQRVDDLLNQLAISEAEVTRLSGENAALRAKLGAAQ